VTPVDLWIQGQIRCSSLTLEDGQIEICIICNGVIVSRELFQKHNEAARYAIDKMHAYNVA
jgi:hypothetical protein